MPDQPPVRFFIGKKDALSADAEGHHGHQEQHDEVHHVLDHPADHHHVRPEVLAHAQRPQAADVPGIKVSEDEIQGVLLRSF